MESTQQSQYEVSSSNGSALLDGSATDDLPMLPPATSSSVAAKNELQEYTEKFTRFLGQLPEYIGSFFNEYKAQITSVALLVAAVLSVRIVLAILDALDDIPLVTTFFELVGIGYVTWFVSRYMLKASTRQEVMSEIKNFKQQILGQNSASEAANAIEKEINSL
jgi:CAAD domains of cyanobacterial aminoacyl-tRNA synthetase